MPTVDRRKLYLVAFCDPAGGPRAGRSNYGLSRAAIVVIGQDDLERVFILEAFIQRIPPDKLIDRIFDTQQKWNPAVFGIDSSGPQLEFAQMVQKEARERGIRIPLRLVAQRQEKTFSIETTIQPLSSAGRLSDRTRTKCASSRTRRPASLMGCTETAWTHSPTPSNCSPRFCPLTSEPCRASNFPII